MTHEELNEKIGFLSYEVIEHMPPKDLAAITDNFSEDLIRDILVKFAPADGGQRRAWTFIKHNYKEWLLLYPSIATLARIEMDKDGNPFIIYPDFFEQIEFDIKYDIPLKKAPPISPLPPINEIVYNINTKGSDKNQEKVKHEARIAKLEAELKSRDEKIAEKDAEIASLQKQLAEERQKRQNLIEDFSGLDEVQRMSLHQKIVFFTTVTSVLLDKRYTNMRNLASFIASMCNEKAKTIGPMLSRIGQITDENPNPQLSSTLNTAAQSVSDMLLSVLTDATKNDETQIINKIRENLLLNYPSPEDE